MDKVFRCSKCKEIIDNETEAYKHEGLCGISTDTVPVVEFMFATQSMHENARQFFVFKKTLPISEHVLDCLNMVKTNDEFCEFLLDNLDKIGFDKEAIKWFDDYFMLEEYEVDRVKDIKIKPSWYEDITKHYLEANFKYPYNEPNCIHTAYMSFFEMTVDDLNKQDDVKVELRKFLTDNKFW